MRRLAGLALAALAATVLISGSAQASFPGKNGKIAVRVGRDIYSVGPDGSNAQPIATAAPWQGFQYAAWSPDGQRIALADGGRVWIANADGSDAHVILASGGDQGEVGWSPDGQRLVVARNLDFCESSCPEQYDLWTLKPDGSEVVQITCCGRDAGPDWSPVGDRIAFSRIDLATGRADIHTAKPDGSDITRVTTTGGGSPSWSPDARSIAFGSDLATPFRGQIFKIDVQSGASSRITNDSNDDFAPVWSPDGTKLAFSQWCFASSCPGKPDSFTINSDGTGASLLGHDMAFPDWQPIPSPRRSDYKNANQFCKAERDFWDDQFSQRYRNFGQCVSGR